MCKTKLQQEIERRELANKQAPFPVYDTEIIEDFKILEQMRSKPNYDNEKVDYCKTCASIALKTVTIPSSGEEDDAEITYCIPCGNTEIETAQDIFEWEDIYEAKHGEKFLSNNRKKD